MDWNELTDNDVLFIVGLVLLFVAFLFALAGFLNWMDGHVFQIGEAVSKF